VFGAPRCRARRQNWRFFFLLAELDGAAVCLDTKDEERQPDQQHAEGEKQKGGKYRLLGRLGRDDVAGAGEQPRLNGPRILPTPFAVWPRPEERAPMRTPLLSTV